MRKLCGTGHRAEKLGEPDGWVRVALRAAGRARIEVWQPTEIISGMATGWDQDLASIAVELGIPLTAAVPFPEQPALWPLETRRLYNRLLEQASKIVYVSTTPRTKRDAIHKLHLRNQWMLNQIGRDGVVLAAWDGSPGGTASCYAMAEVRELTIDRIDPRTLQPLV